MTAESQFFPEAPAFPMHVSVADATARLRAVLPTRGAVTLPLEAALNRTLAIPLMARVSHPSATESALDGVACREADAAAATSDCPVLLRVVGESRAGHPCLQAVGAGECVRIYTGAPLPAGADAICPVEQLADAGPDHVGLRRPARTADVRPEGQDFRTGEVVMQPGSLLTPSRLALAATMGYAQVPVVRSARVALLSTGDEVISPGQPIRAGQVYDSNRVGLRALLTECGCEVVDLGRTPDRVEALQDALNEAGGADLLLSSGGVSMGRYDFMRDLLIGRGQVLFWKIRMRPGGPAILGRWSEVPVFGLPGNPVSSLVVFQVVVRPALTGQPPRTVRLRADAMFRGAPDRVVFARGVLGGRGVRPYVQQSSGVLRSLSESDVLVVVPTGQEIQAGDEVDVILL